MPRHSTIDSALLSRYAEACSHAAEMTLGEPVLYGSRLARFFYIRVIMAEWLRGRNVPMVQIGKVIKKDHSTVVHTLQSVEGLMYYKDFRKMRETFRKEIDKYYASKD